MLSDVRFLLVHSPALGPSMWRCVGGALHSRGHDAIVPNLVGSVLTGDPGLFAHAAAEAAGTSEETAIVGHSAAGTVLPIVGMLTPNVRRLIFVDASLPPCEGTCTAGGAFLEALQGLAANGMLPPWSQWWGEEVLEARVRDEARRRQIEAELSPLPLAFFEAPIALPAGWCEGGGAFLLLSEFYRSDASRAAALGWPVVERPGAHLDMVNDEDEIADVLIGLADCH